MPDKQIEKLESDVRTLISFFEAYCVMDAAAERYRKGGQYIGDKRAAFDLAWKVLRTHEFEAAKIAESVRKEEEVERV
jgi:hypothetical protein